MTENNTGKYRNPNPYTFARIILIVVVIGWIGVVGISFLWGVYAEKKQMQNLVMNTARENFNKDQAFRLWGASHGGVYVPIDKETPPNPYLSHMPERDIVTPAGKHLTLMNPAYMVRQLMEQYTRLYGIKGHITSLNPLNPLNAPDQWEQMGLKKFEEGIEEIFEFTEIKGEPYIRLMRPMITSEGCLKCHSHQGYKVGNIRGGVGVSVPIASYHEIGRKVINIQAVSHLIIGIFGLALIGFVGRRAKLHIDERTVKQDALLKAHDELEVKVEERTREILEANVKLKEMDRMKSMFIASMSHELRTPLNSIMGFTGVMLGGMSGSINARQEDQLNRVYRSSQHLLVMINDIIDISRIEAGKVNVVLEGFLLVDLVEEAVDNIKPGMAKKGLAVELSVHPDLKMYCDRKRLMQCIANLLSNAVKFTESGVVRVEADAMEGVVTIKVRDTGIGILAKDLSRLFQPFERIASDISIKEGGTGLGLYLTRKLVIEVLRGEIEVESEEGRGSTFKIIIPQNSEINLK